jgi:hypothetical protein
LGDSCLNERDGLHFMAETDRDVGHEQGICFGVVSQCAGFDDDNDVISRCRPLARHQHHLWCHAVRLLNI